VARLIRLVSLWFRVYVPTTLGLFLLALYSHPLLLLRPILFPSCSWPIIFALSASYITIFNLTFLPSNEFACLCQDLLLCPSTFAFATACLYVRHDLASVLGNEHELNASYIKRTEGLLWTSRIAYSHKGEINNFNNHAKLDKTNYDQLNVSGIYRGVTTPIYLRYNDSQGRARLSSGNFLLRP
jgi:hypothetical protein